MEPWTSVVDAQMRTAARTFGQQRFCAIGEARELDALPGSGRNEKCLRQVHLSNVVRSRAENSGYFGPSIFEIESCT